MKKKYQLTANGKQELEEELVGLKAQRGDVAQKIADARDYGDISENAEYDAARDEQGRLESRIREIEEILLNAVLIKTKDSAKVDIGSRVSLEGHEGKKAQYTIVGSIEANPAEGRISNESPIGQALLGKVVGHEVEIKTPRGSTTYKVMAIE